MRVILQLRTQLLSQYEKDAEDCIKIYQFLKELDHDNVDWVKWNMLVKVALRNTRKWHYKPTKIGRTFLKGLKA